MMGNRVAKEEEEEEQEDERHDDSEDEQEDPDYDPSDDLDEYNIIVEEEEDTGEYNDQDEGEDSQQNGGEDERLESIWRTRLARLLSARAAFTNTFSSSSSSSGQNESPPMKKIVEDEKLIDSIMNETGYSPSRKHDVNVFDMIRRVNLCEPSQS